MLLNVSRFVISYSTPQVLALFSVSLVPCNIF